MMHGYRLNHQNDYNTNKGQLNRKHSLSALRNHLKLSCTTQRGDLSCKCIREQNEPVEILAFTHATTAL